ncbi:MAG: GAF domain-containing protein [Ignavibacteriales bacterium]|nr:GAF domain-containing protein [Ignavibacteriales bacterium]
MVDPKTILIFSDDPESISLYQATSSELGKQLLFKSKSLDSLRILSIQKFDLIIYEFQKPNFSEIDFFDSLYRIAVGIPICIISEFFYDTRNIVFGNKPAAFILKPLNLDKVMSLFENIFEQPYSMESLSNKETQIQFSLQAKKLSVLLEISKRINSKTDLDDLLNTIISISLDILNAERATLFILDKGKNQLWSRVGTNINYSEIRFPSDQGIAGEVAITGASQIIDSPYLHPKFNKEIDAQTGFVTRNILCVPLKNLKGDIIGVFETINKKEGNFTKDDEDFINILAVNTGISLENTLLQEKLVKQFKELQHSYEELYISQKVMIKEAKFSTLSEIHGYIKNENNALTISRELEEIKSEIPENLKLRKNISSVAESLKSSFKRLENYLDSMKKNL